MIRNLAFSILVLGLPLSVLAQTADRASTLPALPPDQVALYDHLQSKLSASARVKMQQIVMRLRAQTDALPNADLAALARSDAQEAFSDPDRAISNMGLNDGDIEAVAFIVLMSATNDMDKDLKQMMAETKAMTASKAKVRDQLSKVRIDDSPTPLRSTDSSRVRQKVTMTQNNTAAAMPNQANDGDQSKKELDSMNEMSEMTSLRLQSVMDRRTKFISTLSNVMKNISSTQDKLIENLK